jgi:hypothetical protein
MASAMLYTEQISLLSNSGVQTPVPFLYLTGVKVSSLFSIVMQTARVLFI